MVFKYEKSVFLRFVSAFFQNDLLVFFSGFYGFSLCFSMVLTKKTLFSGALDPPSVALKGLSWVLTRALTGGLNPQPSLEHQPNNLINTFCLAEMQ